MARFQIDTQKTDGVSFWTNRYFVEAADINAAMTAGVDIIITGETLIHTPGVTINFIRASTVTPGDLVFRTSPRSDVGTLGLGGEPLPLFNCVRVDFGVSSGRPSRKFYRSRLGGGDLQPTYEWSDTRISAISAAVTNMMADLSSNSTPLVDPQGQLLFGHTTFSKIAMHQLKRGSKRRTTPVLSASGAEMTRQRAGGS